MLVLSFVVGGIKDIMIKASFFFFFSPSACFLFPQDKTFTHVWLQLLSAIFIVAVFAPVYK